MQQLAAAEPPDAPALPPARRVWVRSAAALAVGALILGLFIYYFRSRRDPGVHGHARLDLAASSCSRTDRQRLRHARLALHLPPAVAARVPFVSLYLTRMAGEAVNSLTVAVGGEPLKAHLLRAFGVSGSDGPRLGGDREDGAHAPRRSPSS